MICVSCKYKPPSQHGPCKETSPTHDSRASASISHHVRISILGTRRIQHKQIMLCFFNEVSEILFNSKSSRKISKTVSMCTSLAPPLATLPSPMRYFAVLCANPMPWTVLLNVADLLSSRKLSPYRSRALFGSEGTFSAALVSAFFFDTLGVGADRWHLTLRHCGSKSALFFPIAFQPEKKNRPLPPGNTRRLRT